MRWKTLFAGTTALVLVGCSFAYAQKPTTDDKAAPQSDKTAPGQSSTRKLPLEERAAIMDARIAVHKAALKLTPDQEQKWPAYEAALRNLAKLRVERHQELKSPNPVDHLRQRAEDLSTASTALKQLADAEEPLYNSLDDAQKSRLSTYCLLYTSRRRGGRMRVSPS